MAKRSQQWKQLERDAAEALGGRRVLRGSDFSESAPDVLVDGLPQLKVDCKYRTRHSHHSLLNEVVERYCAEGDIPVLITKSHRQKGACVTVTLDFFADLLDAKRALDKYVAKKMEELHAEDEPAVDEGGGEDDGE